MTEKYRHPYTKRSEKLSADGYKKWEKLMMTDRNLNHRLVQKAKRWVKYRDTIFSVVAVIILDMEETRLQMNGSKKDLFLNSKQYDRIMRRQLERRKFEETHKIHAKPDKFMHKTRHDHAKSRPRGKGGRFLTREEIRALEQMQSN